MGPRRNANVSVTVVNLRSDKRRRSLTYIPDDCSSRSGRGVGDFWSGLDMNEYEPREELAASMREIKIYRVESSRQLLKHGKRPSLLQMPSMSSFRAVPFVEEDYNRTVLEGFEVLYNEEATPFASFVEVKETKRGWPRLLAKSKSRRCH